MVTSCDNLHDLTAPCHGPKLVKQEWKAGWRHQGSQVSSVVSPLDAIRVEKDTAVSTSSGDMILVFT